MIEGGCVGIYLMSLILKIEKAWAKAVIYRAHNLPRPSTLNGEFGNLIVPGIRHVMAQRPPQTCSNHMETENK